MANIELKDADTEENNVIEVQSEPEVEAKDDGPSMRDALKAQLDREVEKPADKAPVEAAPTAQEAVAQPQQEKPMLAPPADMRKEEKEAFLNPTPENAHVLQAYMNRRAYETRSDYQRKMAEVEQLKQQTSGLYDVLKQHETDYAKHGISIGDVARRSIAWDKAMQANPIETAREWLDAYGISPQDLLNGGESYDPQFRQMPPQANYLTKEEAERIAEEKFKAIKDQEQKNAVAYYNERIVESFLNSKPLFKDPETASQLEAEMAPIVSGLAATGRYSSPEEILETAYRYVVAGNPTFSSLTSAMAAKSQIEQKQAEVAKAKTASRSISGSAGSGTPRVQTKNLRDNLRRRFVDG